MYDALLLLLPTKSYSVIVLTIVLIVDWQALKMLRTPQLKPYIIYIKPPLFDELKESRQAAHARSTFDETNSRGFTVLLAEEHNIWICRDCDVGWTTGLRPGPYWTQADAA